MPIDRDRLAGTGVADPHAAYLLDYIDTVEATGESATQSAAANASSLSAYVTALVEVPIHPFFGTKWEVRTTVTAYVLRSTSKLARCEITYADGLSSRDHAVFDVVDGGPLGKVTCEASVVRSGVITPLGSQQSSGSGARHDVVLPFVQGQVGPGVYVFAVTTADLNATYLLQGIRLG